MTTTFDQLRQELDGALESELIKQFQSSRPSRTQADAIITYNSTVKPIKKPEHVRAQSSALALQPVIFGSKSPSFKRLLLPVPKPAWNGTPELSKQPSERKQFRRKILKRSLRQIQGSRTQINQNDRSRVDRIYEQFEKKMFEKSPPPPPAAAGQSPPLPLVDRQVLLLSASPSEHRLSGSLPKIQIPEARRILRESFRQNCSNSPITSKISPLRASPSISNFSSHQSSLADDPKPIKRETIKSWYSRKDPP